MLLRSDLIDADFFVFAMRSKYLRDQIELSISGADGLANNIPQASVKAYQLALPPLCEQKFIADKLHEKLDNITAQEVKISDVISRLKEYRSSLVTSAVTGKIDVRAFVVPARAGTQNAQVDAELLDSRLRGNDDLSTESTHA